jgi:plasmid stabilization system protein ParE
MKYNLIVFSNAEKRRKEHVNFLARVNLAASVRLDSKLKKEMQKLCENPQNCRRYESEISDITNLYYKFVPKRYRIVFGIEEDTVYIYDVQDCRQDEDKKIV